MFLVLLFAALCASSMAAYSKEMYFYTKAVGNGQGTSYATKGTGRITGVRVWEIAGNYITGIQLRYDQVWTNRVGHHKQNHIQHELNLFDGETIVQVSGKYHSSHYIYQVIFVTSRGRSLIVGQPLLFSFNLYQHRPDAELKQLSGSYNGAGITSLGAHWVVRGTKNVTISHK